MAQVWALGIMGKIFSGPWMTKFYSSEMSNLDMVRLCFVDCSLHVSSADMLFIQMLSESFSFFLRNSNSDVLTSKFDRFL